MQTAAERNHEPPGHSQPAHSRWLLSGNADARPAQVIVYCVILFIVALYSLKLMTLPMHQAADTFIHYINLPIHETGHLVFMPLGEFMHFLGGTLGQILMPLIIMLAFLIKQRDAFSAAVMFWWAGENFIDIAPYINDARTQYLPLVGGGRHDWAWLLGRMNLLSHDHTIAQGSYYLGVIIMITALIWAAVVLYHQIRWLKFRNSAAMRSAPVIRNES